MLELEQIYRMFSPLDENTKIGGGRLNGTAESVQQILQTSAIGVDTPETIVSRFNSIPTDQDAVRKQSIVSIYNRIGTDSDDALYRVLSADGKSTEQIQFNKIVDSLGDEKSDTCIILVHDRRITPLTDNSSHVETFLNFMPPMVMSMCYPYFDVQFQFDRGAVPSEDGSRLTTPSMLKFLLGGQNISGDDATSSIYNTSIVNKETSDKDNTVSTVSTAGIELFTMPQTLQNYNEVSSDNRYVSPLDLTRPLATLESVSINVKGTTGLFSYKTAQLQIRVHDRSRLSELADLLQPASTAKTTIWMSYGWKHGLSKNEQSPYADFINDNMIVREAYGLQNSSFSFDASGQVNVTLQLFSKGTAGLHNLNMISSAPEFAKLAEWRILSEKIRKNRKLLGLESPDLGFTGNQDSKDVFGYTILNSASEFSFPSLEPKEVTKALGDLEKALNGLKKNSEQQSAATELIMDLGHYLRPSADKKNFDYFEKVKSASVTIVARKFKSFDQTFDPFLIFDKEKESLIMKHRYGVESNKTYRPLEQITQFMKTKKKVVSFGKIVCSMLCPGLRTLAEFDCHEIFFYNINDDAGYASNTNIAEFPIDVELFKNQYQQYVESVASENITIENFIKMIIDSQISDYRAIPYGFRNMTGIVNVDSRGESTGGSLTELGTNQFPILSQQFNESGKSVFKFPQIDVYLDVKEARDEKNKKVLRIHIFDRTLNPYPDEIKSNLPSVFDRRTITDLASRNIPMLIPGMNASAIFESTVATKTNALLQTRQLLNMNSGKNAQATPRGSGAAGLPLKITPVSMTMRTLGCPIINFAQLFFIDQNTGTTIDNRYGVVGLTHEMKPGNFQTSIQFALYDSYAKFESIVIPEITHQNAQ